MGAVAKDTDTIEHAKARIRFWLDPEFVEDDWAEDEIVGWLESLRATPANAVREMDRAAHSQRMPSMTNLSSGLTLSRCPPFVLFPTRISSLFFKKTASC